MYPAGSAPEVLLSGEGGSTRALTPVSAHPFEDASMDEYQVVIVRFADLAAGASVTTVTRPLAIGTLYK